MALWAFVDAGDLEAGANPVKTYKRAATRSALLRYLSFDPDAVADWNPDRIIAREDPPILIRNQKSQDNVRVNVCQLQVV